MKDFFLQLCKSIGISRHFVILILSGLTLVSKYKSKISKPVIQKLFRISDDTFPIIPFCFWTGIFALLAGILIITIRFIHKKRFEKQGDVGNYEIAKLDIQIFGDCMVSIILFGWFCGIILYNMR